MTTANTLHQAQALADALPRLVVAAERLAFIAAPGLHGRRRPGQGDSFWQFREWQPGEDTRRIDWRRSAQGDRLYTRDQEQDVPAHIALAIHDTATLDFQSTASVPPKRERAVLLLLAIAAILLRAGERVALNAHTPPLSGPNALARLAAGLVVEASAPANPRARLIHFGDFLLASPSFNGPAGGAVIQILDPAECDFPYRGRVVFTGMAPPLTIEAQDAQAWGEVYRNRIAAQRDAVVKAAQTAGQTPLFHRTDAPPAITLAALYQALARS